MIGEIYWLPYVSFWLSAILLDQLVKLKCLQKYKYNKTDVQNLISKKDVITSIFLYNLTAFFISYFTRDQDNNSQSTTTTPTATYISVARLLVYMFVDETYSYWYHYALHKYPTLYKYIHRQHHNVFDPHPFSSQYGSFLDIVIGIWFPQLLSMIVSGLSLKWVARFMVVRILKGNYDHLGYDLPFSLNPFNNFLVTNKSRYHFIHHTLKGRNYNYSNGLSNIWDRINNTYQKN